MHSESTSVNTQDNDLFLLELRSDRKSRKPNQEELCRTSNAENKVSRKEESRNVVEWEYMKTDSIPRESHFGHTMVKSMA